jgi:hypothetical protein
MMVFGTGLILTQLSLFVFFWIFRRLALQKHEALILQRRHNEQLVTLLLETAQEESATAEKATKFVQQLRDEMRELAARHAHEARWWFRPADGDAAGK